MNFRIINSSGQDKIYWKALINKIKPEYQDLHFLPEYGQIYYQTYREKPFLAFYGNETDFIIQPFLLKPLTRLPFLKNNCPGNKYFDLVNPYGYGGPLISSAGSLNLIKPFRKLLNLFCQEKNVISEFSCLHPFCRNYLIIKKSHIAPFQKEKEIVYINLSKTKDQLWSEISNAHRRNILKAKQRGVLIEKVALDSKNCAIFKQLYYRTMNRHQAQRRWFFPENYFSNCIKCLGDKRVSLFMAYIKDKPISAYLLIHDFKTVYYHFGGSDAKYYQQKPNNLLIYEIALWAKRKGFQYFHLGGGVTSSENDSLFMFKSGFSSDRGTLYSYRIIHNQSLYKRMCNLKKQYDLNNKGKLSNSSYFPYYRQD